MTGLVAQSTAGPLVALRILGGIIALGLFAVAAGRYARRSISRLTLIIIGLLAVAGLVLVIAPVLYNPVFRLLHVQKGGGQRLIGGLVFANIIFFFLLFRTTSQADAEIGRASCRERV